MLHVCLGRFSGFSGRREEATLIVACTHTTLHARIHYNFNRGFFFFSGNVDDDFVKKDFFLATWAFYTRLNVLTFAKMT